MSHRRTRLVITTAAIAAGCSLAAAGTAAAAALNSTQAAAVNSVEKQAASLPPANTPQQAQANQNALQPSVNRAVGDGPTAVSALVSSGDPSVATDLLRQANVTTTSTDTSAGQTTTTVTVASAARAGDRARITHRRTRLLAHAAGCWGSHSTQVTISAAGVDFGWRRVTENGWCGNGSKITWNGGASFNAWHGGPYCWNDTSSDWSWDVPFSWIHGRNYGVLGGSYVWGCASLQTVYPVIRIAANGHYDHYNDY